MATERKKSATSIYCCPFRTVRNAGRHTKLSLLIMDAINGKYLTPTWLI